MIASDSKGWANRVLNTDASGAAAVRRSQKAGAFWAEIERRGLGERGNPVIGQKAAEESRPELLAALEGADLVFYCRRNGLAHGPQERQHRCLAEVAKDGGALTRWLVTKPFSSRGASARSRRKDYGLQAG